MNFYELIVYNDNYLILFSFISWFILTLIWSTIKDETKRQVLVRFLITFILNLIYLFIVFWIRK